MVAEAQEDFLRSVVLPRDVDVIDFLWAPVSRRYGFPTEQVLLTRALLIYYYYYWPSQGGCTGGRCFPSVWWHSGGIR